MKQNIIIVLIYLILLNCLVFAQISKDAIKTILILQGISQNIDEETEILFDKYIDFTKHDKNDLFIACGWAVLSGIALGNHESTTFGYSNSSWLPDFAEKWYNWKPQTDAVLGKTFTWQKVWRDIDYASNIAGYNKFKRFYGVKKFLSLETLYSYLSMFLVKNTFASFIRNKFKHNKFFYSWDLNLLLTLQ